MKCTLTLLLLWVLPATLAFQQSNDGKFVVHRVCCRAVYSLYYAMGVLATLALYVYIH